MKNRMILWMVASVLFFSFLSPADAADKTQIVSNFVQQGLKKLFNDPLMVVSESKEKIKSLTSDFAAQITDLLLSGENKELSAEVQDKAIEKVMQKASLTYSPEIYNLLLGKEWSTQAQAFIDHFGWKDLKLSAETQNKIEEITRGHFQQIAQILKPLSAQKVSAAEQAALQKQTKAVQKTTPKSPTKTTQKLPLKTQENVTGTSSSAEQAKTVQKPPVKKTVKTVQKPPVTTQTNVTSSSTATEQTSTVSQTSIKSKAKSAPKTTTKSQGNVTQGTTSEENTSSESNQEEGGAPSFGVTGGQEEDHNVNDITVSGSSVKEITVAGLTFTGNFIQQSSGIYLVQGDIKPKGFDISLGAAGQLTIDKNRDSIVGEMYIKVPVYGKVIQITDFIFDKTKKQIKFRGKFEEKVTIPVVHADLSLAKGLADFEISTSRLACQASGGVVIDISIPKVGQLSFDILSGDAGFATSIPPEGISVSGGGTVTIPFEPPLEVDLEGSAEITKTSLSGTGSATILEVIEIGNGSFEIGYNGIMTVNANVGAFLKDFGIEANVASTKLTVDIPQRKLTASLSQSIKLLDLITIPGSVKGDLTIDGKAKILSVSGAAGLPLTGTAIGPESLSLGVKNFLIKVTDYSSKARALELNGDLYVSVWTFAGFNGKVAGTVLDGKGNFYLPPGLKQLLDIDKVSLPVKVDLKAGAILGDLGGDIVGVAIKHFPLEGPKIIVKNDGIHLKGQIGISNVITIPLGDLVFTQSNSYTTINGDVGLGPFTMAEGSFTFPSKDNDPIGFSAKIGIPALSAQKLSGSIYTDGRLEFSGLTKIGLINVKSVGKFSVSKSGLHADTAKFGLGLGGVAECALNFTGLDITPSEISGTATGSFSGVLGIGTSLSGHFSFDGNRVQLSYPSAVSLCGISVSNATLNISIEGVTGSGKITLAGKTANVSITLENGLLKLKGPAGELIAEGLNIASQFKDTVVETASQEKEVVTEDADSALDNLSRMSDPWIKDMVAVATTAKNFFKDIERVVNEEVLSRVKAVLDDLKKAIDAAVSAVKAAISAAVDAVCDGITALIDGVEGIFSDIESLIPSQYSGTYNTIKNKIISKATTLKQQIVLFRNDTKNSLYNLTSPITALYQSAIDVVTDEATQIAGGIKKQVEPMIKEIDQLLTEVSSEVRAAKNAVGDEAQQHYNIAKQKANLIKEKANNIINNYKNKIADLVTPYIKPLIDKLTPYKDKVVKVRDEAIAKGIEGVKTAKAVLDPYIKPFEDAVGELYDFVKNIGGAVFQKFLDGVGAAGNALNTALGAAGKGLVKVTDVLGDGVVAATNAAANASQAAHDAAVAAANAASSAASTVASGASAAVNYVQNAGSSAVNVAVNTAQQGYQTAANVASQAAQAASSTYNNVQQQVSSTVSNVVSHLPSISPSSFATGSPVSFSQIQSGASAVSSKISSILTTLNNYGSSAYNAASGAASSAASHVGSAISSGASTVASGISSGWNTATHAISGLLGGSSSHPSPPPPDYSAPTVSNISSSSTTDSITVNWTTSSNARTLLLYSTQAAVNPNGAGNGTLVASVHTDNYYPETTNHTITVSSLNPGTTYYYIIYCYRDVNGVASDIAKQGVYSVVTQPNTAIIGGAVIDTQSNAVSAASIYVDSSTTPVATTDSSGQYVVEVSPGAHTVIAKKDNYLSSSTTTSSLTAGQILPLDFTLADGRITISGVVKEASSNTGLASATVMLSGLPTAITVPTDANGAFTIMLGTTSDTPVSFTMNVTKTGYTPYTSSSLSLARGAKMQNIEIKLPLNLPALAGDVSVVGLTAGQATISFTTGVTCSAFVQFGPQSSANYLYQTTAKTNKNSFYFDLLSLIPGTAYKYKVVLQDNGGNTVVAKEGVFTTAEAEIGLNAIVDNITGKNAKLNINSTWKILKHQLILKDTTTNVQILNQDLGVLVSPFTLDLTNLIDGHNYKVDVTSSLLASVTSGSVVKTEAKSVSFSTPLLSDFTVQNYDVNPDSLTRGTTTTINATATITINHPVTNAVLKLFAGNQQIYSQTFPSFSPGQIQISVPLAVSSISGVGPIGIKEQLTAGTCQDSRTKTIDIETARTNAAAQSQPQTQHPTTGHATAI